MQPLPVVVELDVFEHVLLRLLSRLVALAVHQLALERLEEGFHERVASCHEGPDRFAGKNSETSGWAKATRDGITAAKDIMSAAADLAEEALGFRGPEEQEASRGFLGQNGKTLRGLLLYAAVLTLAADGKSSGVFSLPRYCFCTHRFLWACLWITFAVSEIISLTAKVVLF